MTGLEKIIKEIQDEAGAEAAAVIEKANAKAGEILSQAKAQSDAKAARIAATAQQDVTDIESARESALHLQRRQRTLQVKQELLAETLKKALDALYTLDDKEYFALLVRLASKSAEVGEGVMLLNEKDLARCPADFERQVSKVLPEGCKLTLSTKTRPIDGGFVLSYGGVEENCSFKDIFDARREEFHDLTRDTLFA